MDRSGRAATAAVIGGGPAGLMAAEVLAHAGVAVTVYERMPSAGRKLLMAGRGGLNLTHSEDLEPFLARYGAARAAMETAVRGFSPDDLVTWAHGLGQETFVGTSGRIFPKVLKASPLLRAWLARLGALGVTIKTRHMWGGWTEDGSLYIQDHQGSIFTPRPDVTVLALGGASWPRLGSDGGWVALLEAAGVAITPLVATNCGIEIGWTSHVRERFAGMPLKRIALSLGARRVRGEAVITRQGIEGGAVYALSAAIREALTRDGTARIALDLRPDMTLDDLARKLDRPRGKQSLANHLRKIGISAAEQAMLRDAAGGSLAADAAALAGQLKELPLIVTGMAGLERAISTAGGVPFSALNSRLMLLKIPGVFVAGEMLDWEAPTGGYLLQGCFATGKAAADGALTFLAQREIA